MLPSPTADATRLTGLNRTATQAKIPGTLVSQEVGIAAVRPASGFLQIVSRQENHGVGHCGGLFIFIGADAETEWLPPDIARNPRGYSLRTRLIFILVRIRLRHA